MKFVNIQKELIPKRKLLLLYTASKNAAPLIQPIEVEDKVDPAKEKTGTLENEMPFKKVLVDFVRKKLAYLKNFNVYEYLYDFFKKHISRKVKDVIHKYKSKIFPFIILWTCITLLLGLFIGHCLDVLNGIVLIFFLSAMLDNFLRNL